LKIRRLKTKIQVLRTSSLRTLRNKKDELMMLLMTITRRPRTAMEEGRRMKTAAKAKLNLNYHGPQDNEKSPLTPVAGH